MFDIDRLLISFDRGLRTLLGPAASARPVPGQDIPDNGLNAAQRRRAAALMRVNHTGEICAQALYQGQALTARRTDIRETLEKAAREENDHLAWTEARIHEVGTHTSYLNPLFYAGSFALGAAAGLIGDKWSLGFLAETERQVVDHLTNHLSRLPAEDERRRAIVERMREEEGHHATVAIDAGAAELPTPVKRLMRLTSKLMTKTAHWI